MGFDTDSFGGLTSESMLGSLVRLKLPWIECTGEVITTLDLLRDVEEQERLSLTDRDVDELIETLYSGEVKAKTFEGYILWEIEYREYHSLNIVNLIWG